MLERNIHVVQPYWVGTKNSKSLALIIPSQIAKEQNLNASTVFVLKVDNTKIVLQVINAEHEDEETAMTPAGESFEASIQQASSNGVP